MFGLDARVTLLVFAILSTLTGFVLYQRFEEAQDVKLYSDLKEAELALKLLQRDFGVLPYNAYPLGDNEDMFTMLCDVNKVSSAFQSGWKGPYINKSPCTSDGIYRNGPINFRVYYDSLNGINSSGPAGGCTATGSCYAWIGIVGVPNSFFLYLNNIVDQLNGEVLEASPEDNGRVVYDSGNTLVYYRTEVHQ